MIIGVLTDVGKQKIAEWICGISTIPTMYIAWGQCDTDDAATRTDTALVGEIDRAEATTTISTHELTMAMTEENTGDGYWTTECGIFDASSGGNMIYRGLYSEDSSTAESRYVNPGDTLSVSIVFNFATGTLV